MATRVPVVLAQFPRRQSDRQQLEEELVGGLLMEDAIEVTVVPDVEQLEDDETGLLCLEGIRGDLVLLSWRDSREAHALLRQAGIEARFGETPLSTPSAEDAGTTESSESRRRIFHMDLRRSADATQFRGEIQQIREALATQTVDPFQSLGAQLLAPPTLGGEPPKPANVHAAPSDGKAEAPQPTAPANGEPQRPANVDDYEDDDQLDALLDQLDDLD